MGDTTSTDIPIRGVPNNPALSKIPYAMKVAHERYKNRFCTANDDDDDNNKTDNDDADVVILFVVQDGETNTVDQRLLEFQLWENYKIPVVRMSLTNAHSDIVLNEDNGALSIKETGQEISIIYYRAGYAPKDYPDGYDNGKEWNARSKLEKGRATKCPSLGYHLAGTKKVQQQLARPQSLERFVQDDDVVESMRSSFAGLYSLGEDAKSIDKQIVKDIIQNPGKEGQYVLKPQREGGGYNYYGSDLATKLRQNVTIDDNSNEDDNNHSNVKFNKSLGEYILMQRLFPPKQNAILLRSGNIEGSGSTISELGCFGTLFVSSDGKDVLHNEYAGFLLRTKFSNVDEGGVAAGFATLSSPYLC